MGPEGVRSARYGGWEHADVTGDNQLAVAEVYQNAKFVYRFGSVATILATNQTKWQMGFD